MLIIINRHQAELNSLSGGSSFALVGGIVSGLVDTAFLAAACLHWSLCARHSAALQVRCGQSAGLNFSRPRQTMTFAALS
jgi:hypothetical protein